MKTSTSVILVTALVFGCLGMAIGLGLGVFLVPKITPSAPVLLGEGPPDEVIIDLFNQQRSRTNYPESEFTIVNKVNCENISPHFQATGIQEIWLVGIHFEGRENPTVISIAKRNDQWEYIQFPSFWCQ